MNIKEVRDLFLSTYEIQSQVRGIGQIKIVDKMLASFISQAQQDIQRRLLVVEDSVDLTLSTTSNVYNLPSNFGRHKHAYAGDTILEEKPARFIREQIISGSSGFWFAIYQAGNTQQLLTSLTSGTLSLFYYPDFRYYQPSIGAEQDWGNFSGIVYSGKLILPDRYDMAILYYMMMQVIPDYINMYEKEIKSLKGSRVSSVDSAFSYQLGGVDENTKPTGSIGLSVGLSGVGGIIPSQEDNSNKKIRFRVDEGGGPASTKYEGGWTATPTIVNNVSTVVVTSASSEFTNYVQVRINNSSFGWSQTGEATITFTPYPSTGWGSVEIIIEVWD